MRVLVIKPSSFGDILHTFPAIANFQRQLPGVEMDWVVNDNLAEAASLMPGVRRLIPFPRKKMMHLSVIRGFLRELRQENYDVALDFQGLFRSGLISRLAYAKRRVGFADAREGAPFFYTEKIVVPKQEHAVRKNLLLAQKAFALATMEEFPRISLAVSEGTREAVKRLLPDDGDYIAVCFASRWPSKNWTESFFHEALKIFAEKSPKCRILFIGTSGDRATASRLATGLPNASVLAGETPIPMLAEVLAHCRAMLTVDSGPMHLAALVGTPCLALFGATDPVLTGPWGSEGMHVVLRSRCPKAPCFQHQCPLGQGCPQKISAAEAAEELFKLSQRRNFS